MPITSIAYGLGNATCGSVSVAGQMQQQIRAAFLQQK